MNQDLHRMQNFSKQKFSDKAFRRKTFLLYFLQNILSILEKSGKFSVFKAGRERAGNKGELPLGLK